MDLWKGNLEDILLKIHGEDDFFYHSVSMATNQHSQTALRKSRFAAFPGQFIRKILRNLKVERLNYTSQVKMKKKWLENGKLTKKPD